MKKRVLIPTTKPENVANYVNALRELGAEPVLVTDAERMGAMNFHVEPNGRAHSDFAIVPLIRRERRDETLAPGASYMPAPDERMRAWAVPGFGGAAEWRRIVRP